MLDPVYRERFAKLADLIDSFGDPAYRAGRSPFYYGDWFNVWEKHNTVNDILAHPCGTAGCIAGWASILQAVEDGLGDYSLDGHRVLSPNEYFDSAHHGRIPITLRYLGEARDACRYLGLNYLELSLDQINQRNEERYIFLGYFHPLRFDAPRQDVVKKLRRIAETGIVVEPEFDLTFELLDKPAPEVTE